MDDVRVLSRSRVAPSHSQQQQQGGRVKLSSSSIMKMEGLPAVQPLFLYDLPDAHDGGFPAVVSRLKAALADTLRLTQYRPWGGRLEQEDMVVVDYSDAGVAFVVAEAGHGYDMPALGSLVPELDACAAVVSVQVTRLGARGLAVGLSMHQAVGDHREMFRFIEAWASSSREGSSSCCVQMQYYPREIIAPVVMSGKLHQRGRRTTFHLHADGIRSLKRRIDHLAATAAPIGTPQPKPVSTLVALAALGWTAFVRSKGLRAGDKAHLLLSSNSKRWAETGGTGTGEAGILHTVQAMLAAPLLGYDDEDLSNMLRLQAPLFNVTGSPRLRLYDMANFGFEKPARVEVVSMNRDGEMFLLAGRREGEVQVSVSIHPAHLHAFKACFLSYLPIPIPARI